MYISIPNNTYNCQILYNVPDQLQQVRRASAARVYCDNSKDIHEIQPLAFQKPSSFNQLVDCFDQVVIPRVDLSMWKNQNPSSEQ